MLEKKIALYDKGYDSIYAKDNHMEYDNPEKIFTERVGEIYYPEYLDREPLLNEVDHFAECIIYSNEPRSSAKKSYNITKILSEL